MKLTALFLTVAFLQVRAGGFAQTVSINCKDLPLQEVCKMIARQSGYYFTYTTEVWAETKPVTLTIRNVSVTEALDLAMAGQPVEYAIVNKTVAIAKKRKSNNTQTTTSANPSPNADITGKVITTQGEPLSGANVMVDRKGTGTVTKADGSFSLRNVEPNDILTVSFIGYSPLQVKVGDRSNFLLTLGVASNKLDVAVVQAYGKTTERLRTGNISTVTAQEIERYPVVNVLQALQGKVPGLEVTQANGFSTAPFKVEIRGRKYLNNGLAPDPLIIVDGVPLDVINLNSGSVSPNGTMGFTQAGIPNPIGGQSPLASIDPNEIESVTVLKDADATSIYGSRGGSGVILITTKKGKAGPMKCDVSYSSGFSKNLRWFDLMSSQQYVEMRREAFKNDNKTPTAANASDILKWDSTRNTDWQRFTYGGKGMVTNVDANLSGGTKTTNYRISIGYDTRTNITTASGSNDRIAFSNNFIHSTENNALKIELTSIYTFLKINTKVLPSSTLLLPPNAPSVYDATNKVDYTGWNPLTSYVEPFGGLFSSYKSRTGYMNNRLSLVYLPVKGLELKSSIGYNSYTAEENYILPIIAQNPTRNPTGSTNNAVNKGETWILEPQVEYRTNISRVKTTLLVGSTIQSTKGEVISASGYGYTDDNLLGSVANAPTSYGTDGQGQAKYFALFARANLNFDDKYVINVTARRDGSSKFGPGKQFGEFWSFGGAWIISKHKWFESLSKIISFAKLRGSFGTSGSDNISPYGYLTRWSGSVATVNPYSGTQGYQPIQHANPELQWQENRKLEIGTSLNFWKDRISMEIDWYRDRCGNQLLETPLPAMTGFTTVSSNLPATVQNSGWEFKLNVEILSSKNWRIQTNFNLGANRNKLLEFTDLRNSVYSSQYVVGKPLNAAYLYHYLGVNPQTGLYSFDDINHDGVVGSSPSAKDPDAQFVPLIVNYFGGYGVNISYGKLSLSTYFTFGNVPRVVRVFNTVFPGNLSPFGNQPTYALDRWKKPGDLARFASYSTVRRPTDLAFAKSDGFYSNGSYLSLQNLAIDYLISDKITRVVKIKSANVFLRADNVCLFSKYEGIDPRLPGIGSYPYPLTLTFGAKLSF